MKQFTKGLKAGIPIALGYLSVSFTFGIIAVYIFDLHFLSFSYFDGASRLIHAHRHT